MSQDLPDPGWKHFRPRREPTIRIEKDPVRFLAAVHVTDGVLRTMHPVDGDALDEPWLMPLVLEEFNHAWLRIIRARTPGMRRAYRLRSRKRVRR